MSDSIQDNEAQFYHELQRAFFDSTNDAIFVLCDEMKFIVCNLQMQLWLGQSEKNLTQHNQRIPITELLGTQHAIDRFTQAFQDVIQQRKAALFETHIHPENGQARWIELSMRRVDIDVGDMVIAVARDITERKQAEEEKQALQNELLQAHKMDALGQLTGGIAHDFNNILGIISGYTELAQEQNNHELQPHVTQYLRTIFESTERARDLIRQLMVFSRNDQGNNRPLNIAPLIEEHVNTLRATLPSTISIDVSIAGTPPDVVLEPVKLQQILLNTCINARDAINGQGHIQIDLLYTTPPALDCRICGRKLQSKWVQLVISDNGKGMEKDIANEIFKPFYTTKSAGEGSGMGLTMVARILESIGGHILVDSQPGIGTRLFLLFPVADKPQPQHSDRIWQTDRNITGQKTVLIVDDEIELVNFLTEFLNRKGYRCRPCASSSDALRTYRASPSKYELVITDQTMPELTGIQLIQKIRQIRPTQKIILATGYSDEIDQQRADDMGIEFMQKPISTASLLEVISRVLN